MVSDKFDPGSFDSSEIGIHLELAGLGLNKIKNTTVILLISFHLCYMTGEFNLDWIYYYEPKLSTGSNDLDLIIGYITRQY